jgi:hypothetical protein
MPPGDVMRLALRMAHKNKSAGRNEFEVDRAAADEEAELNEAIRRSLIEAPPTPEQTRRAHKDTEIEASILHAAGDPNGKMKQSDYDILKRMYEKTGKFASEPSYVDEYALEASDDEYDDGAGPSRPY